MLERAYINEKIKFYNALCSLKPRTNAHSRKEYFEVQLLLIILVVGKGVGICSTLFWRARTKNFIKSVKFFKIYSKVLWTTHFWV